jgi:nicotinate-nucleotide pyrophosphorylase (carboxylating)
MYIWFYFPSVKNIYIFYFIKEIPIEYCIPIEHYIIEFFIGCVIIMKYDLREIIGMIHQDVGFEDITSKALIKPDTIIKARIISREPGITAGIELARNIFEEFSVKVQALVKDGEKINADDVLLEIEGDARTILGVERTILNLLMRMCGIATTTNNLVTRVHKLDPDMRVAATRKTTPGLQLFEKEAVKLGGGDTHRYRLDDCVLIKDNHIAIVGSIVDSVKIARSSVSFTKKIEIEVENMRDALEASLAGADIIMLDNMGPDEVKDVVKAIENQNLRDNVLIEVSGGIGPDNIEDYAGLGVDIVSTGYLTHTVTALDLSLEIV